jgi:hypothetical protein
MADHGEEFAFGLAGFFREFFGVKGFFAGFF